MSEKPPPPYRYDAARIGDDWCVFVVHDATPHWLQIVARFPSEARAQDYVEMENMLAEDWHEEDAKDPESPRHAPPPLPSFPAAPESRIKPENLRPATPAEKMRVAVGLVAEVATETGQPMVLDIDPGPHEPEAIDQAVEAALAPATETEEEPVSQNCDIEPEPAGRASGNHTDDATTTRIIELLLAGKSIREVVAETGVAKNTVQTRRDVLVAAGRLKAREEVYDEPDRRTTAKTVSPEELDRRVEAVLAAIRKLDATGGKIAYPTVAAMAGMPAGSVAPAIATLKERGLITVLQPGEISGAEMSERGGIRLVKPGAPAISPKLPAANRSAVRAPLPPGKKRVEPQRVHETAEEYIARGGTITRIEPTKKPDPSGTPAFPNKH